MAHENTEIPRKLPEKSAGPAEYKNFVDSEVTKGAETKWAGNLPDTFRNLSAAVFNEDRATAEVFAAQAGEDFSIMFSPKILKAAKNKIATVKLEGNRVKLLDKNGDTVKVNAPSEYTLEFPILAAEKVVNQAMKSQILEKNIQARQEFVQENLGERRPRRDLEKTLALEAFEARGIRNLRENSAVQTIAEKEHLLAGGPAMPAPQTEPPKEGEESSAETLRSESEKAEQQLLKVRETARENLLSIQEIEKLTKHSVRIDEGIASAWIDKNEPWEKVVNPVGREKTTKVLNQPPFEWGPYQLREVIRQSEKDFVSFDDLAGEHGLNLGNGHDLFVQYLLLYQKHFGKFKNLLIEKSGVDKDSWLSFLKAAPDKEEKIEERLQKDVDQAVQEIKKESKEDGEKFEKLRAVFLQSRKLLDLLDRDKNVFTYQKTETVETQETVYEGTDQEIVTLLDNIFGRRSRGPVDSRTRRPMELLDMDGKLKTVTDNDWQRVISGEAAFTHTRDKIFMRGKTPEERKKAALEILNGYLKTGLDQEGKERKFDALKLTTLDQTVTEEFKTYVRKGLVLHRVLESAHQREEQERIYSLNPKLQGLGEDLRRKYPHLSHREVKTMIEKVEQHLRGGVMVGAVYREGEIGPIFGLAGNIDLGQGFSLHVGISYVKPPDEDWKRNLSAGGTYSFKATEKVNVDISIGLTKGIDTGETGAGAGARATMPNPFPFFKEYDFTVGFGAGQSLSTLKLFPTGEVGLSWNPERALENKKSEYGEILASKNILETVRNHKTLGPRFEKMLEIYRATENIPELDEAMQAALATAWIETLHRNAENLAIEELDQPLIPDFGLAYVKGVGAIGIPIPYFTISLGSTTYVTRIVNRENMEISDETFLQNIKEKLPEGKTVEVISVSEKGPIALDYEGRPRILDRGEADLKVLPINTKEQFNEAFKDVHISFTPVEGKPGMLHMEIEHAEDANVKIHMDPDMQSALFYAGRNFYLTVPHEQHLFISRRDFEYPFEKEGAVKEIEIFIKGKPVSDEAIREQEKGFLERLKSSMIREGGNPDHVMLYEEADQWLEANKEKMQETHDFTPYLEAVEALRTATSVKENKEKPIRKNLAELTDAFFKEQKGRKERIIRRLLTEYSDVAEYDPEQILKEMNEFLAKKKETKLEDPLEIMFFINRLVDLSLRDLSENYKIYGEKQKIEEHEWKRRIVVRDADRTRGFVRKDLATIFGKTSQREFAQQMADHLADEMGRTVVNPTAEKYSLTEITPETTGNLFLTLVRRRQVYGLRRSLDYESKKYNLLNAKTYALTSENELERRIALAILELQSPLKEDVSPYKYLNQILPLKLAKFAPFVLGPEKGKILAELYQKKKTELDGFLTADESRKIVLQEFKEMVRKVREAEMSGKNSVELKGPLGTFELLFDDVKTTAGVFEKCGNFTIVAKENFSAKFPQKMGILVGEKKQRVVTMESESVFFAKKIAVLLPIVIEKVARAPKPKPKPSHGGQVDAGPDRKAQAGAGAGKETPGQAPSSGGTMGHEKPDL